MMKITKDDRIIRYMSNIVKHGRPQH